MNQMYPSLHGLKLCVLQMLAWHGRWAIDMINTIRGKPTSNKIFKSHHVPATFIRAFLCLHVIQVKFSQVYIYLFISISGFITNTAA